MTSEIRTRSGRPLSELTLAALRDGALAGDDFRISGEQLEAQAAAAQAAGHRQLADNLRRAAELTGVSNERVFEIYEMLRPGRASFAELDALARRLAAEGMPRVAAFVAEAAEAYRARGIAAPGAAT
jgi:propanediol dehydratase small subunit